MKNTLAFGVIGAGYFGKHYIRILGDTPGAALRAVADRSLETMGNNASALPPSVSRFADAEKIFSDPEIDCVVIATPASTHRAFVLSALGAGKHVLCEKPMAMSMAEAEEIQKAVEKSGRTFMVGHQYLYNDYIRHLKEKLGEKILGTIKYIFAEHFSFGPIRHDIGCFAEMVVHELSLLDYLFSPGEIKHASGRSVDLSQSGRDDFAAVQMQFADGLTAAITVSWFAPEKIRRMTIAGDKGMAVFDDRREEKLKFFLHPYPVAPLPKLRLVERMTPSPAVPYSSVPLPKLSEIAEHDTRGTASQQYFSTAPLIKRSNSDFMGYRDGEIITPAIEAAEPLRNQLEHFISCVQNGTEPVSGIAHGIRVTRMLDTVTRAIA